MLIKIVRLGETGTTAPRRKYRDAFDVDMNRVAKNVVFSAAFFLHDGAKRRWHRVRMERGWHRFCRG